MQYTNTQTAVVNVVLVVVACRPVLLLRSPSELVVDKGVMLLVFFWGGAQRRYESSFEKRMNM